MSETGRAGWLFILSVLIIFIFMPPVAHSQQVVGQVKVLVDGLPADETIVNMVGLKTGDSFSDYQLDQILKRLMRTGLYASGVIYKSQEPQPVVTLDLTRNTLIKEVKIFAPASLARIIKNACLI